MLPDKTSCGTCDSKVPKKKKKKKTCCVHHRLYEGQEAVPELNGGITLKILVGLALAFYQSFYPFVAEGRNAWRLQLEPHPRDPLRISGFCVATPPLTRHKVSYVSNMS